jgi:PAS domain S-box-containing protein
MTVAAPDGGAPVAALPAAQPTTRATARMRALLLPVRFAIVATLIAAAHLASPVARDDRVWIAFVAAGVWAPITGLLDAVARRRADPRAIDTVGALLDFAVLGMIAFAAPEAWTLTLGPLLLVVAYQAYVAGLRFALGLAVVASAIAITAGIRNQPTELPVSGVTLCYPVVLVTVILLQRGVVAVRREAEGGIARLNVRSDALLSGVAEAIVVTTLRGRVRQWNPGAERTFGYAGDEVIGRGCAEVLGLHADVATLDCSRGCALLDAPDAEVVDHEVWRPIGDDQRQPLLATALPVTDEAGAVVEVVHSFRDITRLKQADEAKTLFLATASHELKTPLAVMLGFSELLLAAEDMGPEQKRDALTAIRNRSMQLTDIVNRLLLSSRIEAGRVELSLEDLALDVLVRERVDSFRVATNRAVDIAAADDLPRVVADPDAVVSAIDHLLDNAAKYSPDLDPIEVTLTAGEDDVAFAVTDHGIGMSDEEAAHCFEPFWQAESLDDRRFGGTGIGLYVVHALVEGMGGTIAVDSAPRAGATFTLRLRRADRPPPGAPHEVGKPGETDDGDPSIIQEFMRQLGVPSRASTEGGGAG